MKQPPERGISALIAWRISLHYSNAEKFRGSSSQFYCSHQLPKKHWDSSKQKIPQPNP